MAVLKIDPEFKALIPPLSGEELSQLEANLKADGCRDPLVVWGEILLDGHNRYEICVRLGITFKTVRCEFTDRDAAADWIDANQLGRRNLVPDQMSLLRGRRYNRAKKGHGGDRKSSGQSDHLKTSEKIATQHNVSAKTIRRDGAFAAAVEKVKAVDPEIERKVIRNEAPPKSAVVKAAALLDRAPEQAAAILQGEKKIADVVREERREQRKEKIIEITKGNADLDGSIDGKFPVIYADPPWRYEHVKTESRAIENQYPTLDLDEICALPVVNITHDDCVLFLWATSPKLAESMRVIESWGFNYRTCMVWVKDKIGMGYYARQRHELLLIATRGNPLTPDPDKRPDSVVNAPRLEHSAKPEAFYELIERMYPDFPKIELFCRSPRAGWKVWGNQSA